MRSDLHPIAVEIFQFSASNGVELELQWMSPTENEKADYISRVLANFSRLFHVFRAKLGVHSVDCFANYYSTKVCKFFQVVAG